MLFDCPPNGNPFMKMTSFFKQYAKHFCIKSNVLHNFCVLFSYLYSMRINFIDTVLYEHSNVFNFFGFLKNNSSHTEFPLLHEKNVKNDKFEVMFIRENCNWKENSSKSIQFMEIIKEKNGFR